ncbi:MAG: AP protein [Gemmatales bacterium]
MRVLCFIVFFCFTSLVSAQHAENVIIVTLDGLRWQEMFGGAQEMLLDAKAGGVKDVPGLRKAYWRPTAEARREALMPFVWSVIAKEGQIFGDPERSATALSTNGLKFSYPGYSEMFTGVVDPTIDSNGKKDNPNLSVLEYLDGLPAFRGKVAAVCTWDVFPSIFRTSKNKLRVISGWELPAVAERTTRHRELEVFMNNLPRYWPDNVYDIMTMELAKEELKQHHPRVLYVGLGETDEWAHGRRYDLYLNAAHYGDRFLRELWQEAQKMPQYQGKTAMLVICDHGRGTNKVDWTDHGKDTPGAEYIWMAAMGPGVSPLGVREKVNFKQVQFAATIARVLGEDFQKGNPKAAGAMGLTK